MVNKKGLSDIVATVLIVLLALAAIAIIWAFLQPTITRGGCQVDMRTKCTMTEFQPLSCSYNKSDGSAFNIPQANYQLVKGTAQKAVIVYEFADGSSKTTIVDTPPTQAYQSATSTYVNTSLLPVPTKLKVAATLTDPKCGDTTCDPSTTIVECVGFD